MFLKSSKLRNGIIILLVLILLIVILYMFFINKNNHEKHEKHEKHEAHEKKETTNEKIAEGFSDIYSLLNGGGGDEQSNNLLKIPQCNKINGFSGLFCNANTGEQITDKSIILDPFYNSGSNMDCQGSGLTRSGGNVCLDKTQYRLLTTRGGNVSGHDSEIV